MDMTLVQAFFFKAMIEGWAVSGQKINIPDLPGYKAVPFRDGDFYLLDCYCVTPHSSKSAGTTTIWFQGVPVWIMNYGGVYEERAIAFLKSMLRRAYENLLFVGGRGPYRCSDGSFFYMNNPCPNDFYKFRGREEIFIMEGGNIISLGFHEYWGMSLM